MLDLSFVRDNVPRVEEMLRQRGMDPAVVLKNLREVDTQRRGAITEAETMKARRNALVEAFQLLKKEEKQLKSEGRDVAANDRARAENLEEQALIKKSMPRADAAVGDFNARLIEILSGIPNLPHASVPVGHSPEQNVEVRRWGAPPKDVYKRQQQASHVLGTFGAWREAAQESYGKYQNKNEQAQQG